PSPPPPPAAPPASAIRVVSQTVGTDELLVSIARPEQIAALSHLATDPTFSGISREALAGGWPTLPKNGDAEAIFKHRPTLVLFADYSRIELVQQVQRAGVTVIIFDRYKSLEDAYANLRRLAAAIDPAAQGRAERIIAGCEARMAKLRKRLAGAKPVRVIAPSTYGVVPGRNTTFQDLCEEAAAENLAATLGNLTGHAPPPNEKMLTWPVDKVVLPGDSIDAALVPYVKLPPYQFMSAVRERRVALVEPWQLSCVSHLRIRGYEQLASELHPARFAKPNSKVDLKKDLEVARASRPHQGTSEQDSGRDARATPATSSPQIESQERTK
uniref:ABC transporter substrate-binding protein n=1 Tax=Geminisphaera colitermitum TaxID=1148786 RepID=UPI000694E2FE